MQTLYFALFLHDSYSYMATHRCCRELEQVHHMHAALLLLVQSTLGCDESFMHTAAASVVVGRNRFLLPATHQ
jgi:hypothetical protein